MGIGESEPGDKLEIKQGNIKITQHNSGFGDEIYGLILKNGAHNRTLYVAGETYGGGGTHERHLYLGYTEDSTINNSNYTNGAIVTVKMADGKVGIGETSPQCKLTINGGTGVNSNGGVLGIKQKGDGNDDGITLTSSHVNSTRIYKDGNGHFHLYNTGGGTFTLENVTGNVGIGTTSPGSRFHLLNDGTNKLGLTLAYGDGSNGNSGWNQIILDILGENYNHNIRTRHNSGASPGSDTSNAIDFYLWKGGQSVTALGTQGMSITAAGVGIGTTSPNHKLEVTGDIRLGTGTEVKLIMVPTNGNWTVGSNNSGNGTSNNQFYIKDAAGSLHV